MPLDPARVLKAESLPFDWKSVTAFETLKLTVLCAPFWPAFWADRLRVLVGQKKPGAMLFSGHCGMEESGKNNPFEPLSMKLSVKVF